ncbi:GNAT family N-acetyltransferase [Kinneretia aquatilis]|uniref:GNAT family N-acetyltransferase n=1 Tax=Kinneretia aquatilis TaxID=2070761 RepID=UPI00149540E8|nr:GNAT family N-acetyltransferase [Paucibacter aquatile]WIV98134.1 GNAT family N-acetyltransferase [Paucibacter aquatile]
MISDDLLARLAAPIESPRLWLEPLRASHAAELFDGLQEPELYRWISMDRPEDLESLAAHWQALERRCSPDGQFAWPIWALRRKADGRCLGRLDAEIDAQLNAPNLGYYLLRPAWGQGYASEAVQAATAALRERGVRRIVSTVTVGNRASVRALEKAGFAFTRILKDSDCIDGVMHDDEEYVWTADALSAPAA